MPDNALVTSTFAGLPADYCFTTFNRLFLDAFAQWSGYLPGTYSTFIASQSEPGVEDRDKVWIQLDASDIPTSRNFRYESGGWFARHPRRQDGETWQDERMWWVGSEADAITLDGGNADPVSTTSGPMWERDTDFDARFPIQAGTLASSLMLAPGDTGGVENVTLTLAQLPTDHKDWRREVSGGGDISGSDVIAGDFGTGPQDGTLTTGPNGGGLPHTNMPPYRTGMWLKPTIRIYLSP